MILPWAICTPRVALGEERACPEAGAGLLLRPYMACEQQSRGLKTAGQLCTPSFQRPHVSVK